MGLLVHETIVTILELIAGCSVAAVISGTTVCVKEQPTLEPTVMQRKAIMFLFVKNAD